MPLAYGGGIDDVDVAKRIFDIGFEKVSLNTSALNNPNLITEVANIYGSQAVIVSIDVKKDFFGKTKVFKNRGLHNTKISPHIWAKKLKRWELGNPINFNR